jgi:hypothetical protein
VWECSSELPSGEYFQAYFHFEVFQLLWRYGIRTYLLPWVLLPCSYR